ncbi:hypothetical protein FJZ28_04085 [Candidatus Peregrinibacteria bacterium]|nr:hypothetical protein [Candidatus Peregrinibacteria bacterium]
MPERKQEQSEAAQSTPDTTGTFQGTADFRRLEGFVASMLHAEMQAIHKRKPNDNSGPDLSPVQEAIRFLQLDIGSIAVVERTIPGQSKDAASEDDYGKFSIVCTMSGTCAQGRFAEKTTIASGIRKGMSFHQIFRMVEERLGDTYTNAVSLVVDRFGGFPPGVRVLPSTVNYVAQHLQAEGLYTANTSFYSVPDIRTNTLHRLEIFIEKMLKEMKTSVNTGNYDAHGVDYTPQDPWVLRLHKINFDYISRFRYLLSKEMFRLEKHKFQILTSTDSINNRDYVHRKRDNLHVAVDPAMRDFTVIAVDNVIESIKTMCDEWSDVVVVLCGLRQAGKAAEDDGPLATLHNLRKADGVTVEFYVKSRKPE